MHVIETGLDKDLVEKKLSGISGVFEVSIPWEALADYSRTIANTLGERFGVILPASEVEVNPLVIDAFKKEVMESLDSRVLRIRRDLDPEASIRTVYGDLIREKKEKDERERLENLLNLQSVMVKMSDEQEALVVSKDKAARCLALLRAAGLIDDDGNPSDDKVDDDYCEKDDSF